MCSRTPGQFEHHRPWIQFHHRVVLLQDVLARRSCLDIQSCRLLKVNNHLVFELTTAQRLVMLQVQDRNEILKLEVKIIF